MHLEPPITVLLPVYEGPLDLLLELIERAELDITKVALAQVTDQYMAYLHQAPEHGLADLASFLIVAARLLQIKSEALLPRPPVREVGEEDPGDALARQLIAYKRYKQVAIQLSEREAAGLRTYLRVAPPPAVEPKLDLSWIGLDDLRRALQQALAAVPGPTLDESVAAPRVRIRDKILLIVDALRTRGRTTFSSLLKHSRTRLEIVVSFLAVLELMKRQQVTVQQQELFGEIEIVPGSEWNAAQELELESEFEE